MKQRAKQKVLYQSLRVVHGIVAPNRMVYLQHHCAHSARAYNRGVIKTKLASRSTFMLTEGGQVQFDFLLLRVDRLHFHRCWCQYSIHNMDHEKQCNPYYAKQLANDHCY